MSNVIDEAIKIIVFCLQQITTDDDHYRNSIPDSVRQPRNVQDHINQYRQQKLRQLSSETSEEVQPDFFQVNWPKVQCKL